MAFTNFGYFNNASGGAPTISGTAGDLYTLLDYALRTISNWTRLFNSAGPTFAAVWQPAAGGALPVLCCQDNATASGSAALALMRMAESASSVTAYTDPFPTVAQVANASANWLKSSAVSATTREYHCCVWETGILLAIKTSGTANVWEIFYAGKAFARFAAGTDPYPWVMSTRGSSALTAVVLANSNAAGSPATASGNFFAMRHAGGAIKSEYLMPDGRGSGIGTCSGNAAVGGGFLGGLEKSKLYMHGNGGATTPVGGSPIFNRLKIPHWFQCLHSSYAGVTETDNVNDGSFTGQMLRYATSGGNWMLTSNNDPGY